jgi:pantothenate kinase type III
MDPGSARGPARHSLGQFVFTPPKGTATTILAIVLANVLAGSAIITGLSLLMRGAHHWGGTVEA